VLEMAVGSAATGPRLEYGKGRASTLFLFN
jgi:hypothetical protein